MQQAYLSIAFTALYRFLIQRVDVNRSDMQRALFGESNL